MVGHPLRGEVGLKSGQVVSGGLYGPLTFALMLPVLRSVVALNLPVAVIACGGIHTAAQMQQALEAGANAVQIDSAVWVEPALPNWLVTDWEKSQVIVSR